MVASAGHGVRCLPVIECLNRGARVRIADPGRRTDIARLRVGSHTVGWADHDRWCPFGSRAADHHVVLGKARDRSALTCGLSLSKAALSTDLSPPVENYSIVICYRFTLSSRTCCQSYRDLEVPQ